MWTRTDQLVGSDCQDSQGSFQSIDSKQENCSKNTKTKECIRVSQRIIQQSRTYSSTRWGRLVILSGIFPVKRFEPRPLFKIKIERVRTAGLGFIYCPDKESEREREREKITYKNLSRPRLLIFSGIVPLNWLAFNELLTIRKERQLGLVALCITSTALEAWYIQRWEFSKMTDNIRDRSRQLIFTQTSVFRWGESIERERK